MGFLGDAIGAVVLRYKVEADDAIKNVKNLSKEQQKAARDQGKALQEQGKEVQSLGEKYAKGAAVIAGAYLIAKSGMEALRTEAKLSGAATEKDLAKLGDAAGGLRTRWELLAIAQAGVHGAWKLNTSQIALVIEGMRSLEKKGFDQVDVTNKITDALQKGKLEGLDEFGLGLKSTGDKTKDMRLFMQALGSEVRSVAGDFDKAGDAAQRSAVRMEDGVTRLRTAVGKGVDFVFDKMEGDAQKLARMIGGDRGDDVDAARATGAQERDALNIAQRQQRNADYQWVFREDKDEAARLGALRIKIRRGAFDASGPVALEKELEGLRDGWRDAVPDVRDAVDKEMKRLETAWIHRAKETGAGILEGFKRGMADKAAEDARKKAPARAKAAQKSLDDLMDRALDRDKPILETWDADIAEMEAARRAEEDRAYRLSAGRLAQNQLGDAQLLESIAAWEEQHKAGLAQAEGGKEKSFLAKVFGPIDDFDLYTEALTTLGNVTQAVGGQIYDALVSGGELSAKALKRIFADEIAAQGKRLLAYGIASVLTGGIKMATSYGAVGGPEVAAGMAAIAGAAAIGGIARLVGGGSGGGGGGGASAGGYAGGGASARPSSQDHRDGPQRTRGSSIDGQSTVVVLGGTFSNSSQRRQEADIRIALRRSSAYPPARGVGS